MSSFDDIQLRFHLAHKLHKLRYGERMNISGEHVRRAWPPTGEHDTSDVAVFRALALHSAGHRPETSYTTEERIKNDLDETFRFWRIFADGDYWVFERMAHCCPKCHGSKQRRDHALELASFNPNAEVSEFAPIRMTACECLPPA